MPVYTKNSLYYLYVSTPRHFSYINKAEVNLWYLSDIYEVRNEIFAYLFQSNVGDIFLIGDFFISLGFCGFLITDCGLFCFVVESAILRIKEKRKCRREM